MEHLPPIVLECPECGETYLASNPLNIQPSEKRITFSDGYYIDEINWRLPGIIGCITCELGFFAQNGKLVSNPSWEEYHDKWEHLKIAAPPSAGCLALELRTRRKMDKKAEKIIRKEFWYAGNHTEAGRKLLKNNEKFKKYWLKSLERLNELYNADNINERILKAEINRQLGKFNECTDLIKPSDDEILQAIGRKAMAGETEFFRIN